ncbi:ABC transporter substrate-binding protein [Corynebacterium sanguinis]|uniref:ABC transporter substrate-binding protein n=1 Tax=Corynebacterium sanguinis TaxID=2594913 RepID=UPI0021B19058|nr:ABC transporter substrate-binding protein [Corynebacterium sanguinis]MCT1613000.1 ABC transporter substrate-binding protein [Corynebacterium sanguinis]MCT1804572.1 ABC transporter substrate-binding protein [Corynebacterium sanguinis]MCT1881698.1 ABC transporter substrate-binding protein [Corynebacterium sanguinis]MDN8623054.1 ABC transporter substrate-binding protein [Corynebacterium sanguinis]
MNHTFALAGMTLAAATLLCSCAPAPHSEAAYTVGNCGREVAFTHAPERVVLQDSTAVATLDGLGVLDKVVAKAGYFPPEYFTDAVNARLDAIASLSDRLNNTGHIQITKEAVMAENPDLIIGYSDTVNPQTAGEVPILSEPGFCGEITSASWSDVDAHIDLYARAMGVPERAGTVKEGVDRRIGKLDASVGSGRSVAFVYPGVEGGTTYGYGAASMAAPVSESLGLRNVFADVSERVFEISAEQLVAANPDVIVVLNSGEDNAAGAVTSLPGADSIAAVRSGEVIPMYLSFVEPASPLSVAGAEELQRVLALKS